MCFVNWGEMTMSWDEMTMFSEEMTTTWIPSHPQSPKFFQPVAPSHEETKVNALLAQKMLGSEDKNGLGAR